MNTLDLYLLIPILSLVLVLILVMPLRRFAIQLNLVDKPNFRKVHQNSVPLIGGILVIISSGMSLLISTEFSNIFSDYSVMLIGSFIFLVVGVIDDKMEIRSLLKLIIQIAVAYFAFESGIKIESLYGVFGIYEIPLTVQYILTLLIIVGVMNAFNLMDGIDGLSSGLAIIGLSIFSIIAFKLGLSYLVMLFLSLIGGLLGFLRFNLSIKHKIFMGDAGSLVLGFIMVISGIIMIQSAQNTPDLSVTLATVIGVLALPVADSLRVYRKRIKTGYSPFRPDRTHFHHLVLLLGFKHKWASLFTIFISSCLIIISVLFGTFLNVTIAIITIILIFIIVSKILFLNYQINDWKSKMKQLED